jgi:hypothetical protein
MVNHVEDGEDQVGDQNEKQHKVKRRINPAVVLEILLEDLLMLDLDFCQAGVGCRGLCFRQPPAAALGTCAPALSGFSAELG